MVTSSASHTATSGALCWRSCQSSVLEIMSTNISTTFITCPCDANKTLGIKLPFLVMIIKNVSNAAKERKFVCLRQQRRICV